MSWLIAHLKIYTYMRCVYIIYLYKHANIEQRKKYIWHAYIYSTYMWVNEMKCFLFLWKFIFIDQYIIYKSADTRYISRNIIQSLFLVYCNFQKSYVLRLIFTWSNICWRNMELQTKFQIQLVHGEIYQRVWNVSTWNLVRFS